MFRVLVGALKTTTTSLVSTSKVVIQNVARPRLILPTNARNFSALTRQPPSKQLLLNPVVTKIASDSGTRDLTKYSYRKGRRKSVKAVLKRFYRLHWGGWIRTKCGRHKKLWKKTSQRKRRLRQHVLCNATQSLMLDKMVGSYWRQPKYYVDDPYEPYHSREEWQFASIKPRPYFPPEQQ